MDINSLKKLKKILKNDLKIIRKKYDCLQDNKRVDGDEKWIIDNFYLFEKEEKTVVRDLSYISNITTDESGLPLLYSSLFRFVADGRELSVDSIGKELSNYDFSVSEIELCQLMLRAVLISKAAEGVEGNRALIPYCVKMLTSIADFDFERLFSFASTAEKALENDSVFNISDNRTKSYFRRRFSIMAKESGNSEAEFAEILKNETEGKMCAYLFEKDDYSKKGRKLLIAEIIMPAVLITVIALITRVYYFIPLLYFPLWEIIRVFVLHPIEMKTPPKIIPKVKEESEETLIAVSSLLPSEKELPRVEKHLKQLYLANKSSKVRVCLLCDLKSSKTEVMPEDEINIEKTKRMFERLNGEFNNSFVLLVRNRVFIKTQNEYAGFERKRGAIERLVRSICENSFNDEDGFYVTFGAVEGLGNIKYIMALDSDTETSLGCVRELVRSAEHPLNTPKINEDKKKTTSGYGVFMPLVENSVTSANKTVFSRIVAGIGGISFYDNDRSERYSDLFSAGLFTGKGLINVNAYYSVLDNKIKKETMLSHDIIEGEFLRVAFVNSAQVTDSFPSSQSTYFSRLHRWVRGDCQNIVFLKSKVRFENGKEENPLNFISRFKIFDNIRRAITPIIAFHSITLSVFMPSGAAWVLITIALLCITAEEWLSLVSAFSGSQVKKLFSHHYGDTIPEVSLCVIRLFVKTMMLPQLAYTNTSAIFRTLYRMAISRKNLLEWVTAAQAEKKNNIADSVLKTIPSALTFIWLVLLGNLFLVGLGTLFLADCPFSVLSGKAHESRHNRLDFLKREKLRSYARDMWNYYAQYCNESNNFLPPDNVQQTPELKVAQRTSPTNIGVMLCSVLVARDLSLITSEEMYSFLQKSFESINKLRRWHGNLFNWYSTENLEPLAPLYVSTVDSGNFLCCLVALCEGLKEYENEHPPLEKIRETAENILRTTDLSPLYNKRRNLFHIGYNLDERKLTDSYYDLLMSEARMTGYYAVASGQIPKKHWAALSRTMSSINGYSGAVSWSGTMFEYFMPYMFLPAQRNTFVYETLEYCVYCQKLRTRKRHLPWGVSESAYNKFDNAMNYQYKAHGVSTIALKREPFDEIVISPYSTFLTLPLCGKSAYRNLEALSELNAYGEFGFFEAIDFTAKRNDTQDYSVIRSYMAHHIGMSLISVDNALHENKMQVRFMKNNDMMSAKSLLLEKITTPTVTVKKSDRQENNEKHEKPVNEEREFRIISVANPNVHILSNGEWTSVIADSGAGHSVFRMRNVLRHSNDLLRAPLGVFAFVKNKNEILPAQRASSPHSHQEFYAQFDRKSVTLKSKGAVFSQKTEIFVPQGVSGEIRRYTVTNRTKNKVDGKLCIYFELSMTLSDRERSHKAFSKLFVTGLKDEKANCIVFKRHSQNEEERMYCACGFVNPQNFRCNLSREEVLLRNEGVFSLNEQREIDENNMGKADVCAYIEADFSIAQKCSKEYEFFIVAAGSIDELYSKIESVRAFNFTDKSRFCDTPFGMDDTAMMMFPPLFYETEKSLSHKRAILENNLSQSVLWKYGISGDNPLIYLETAVGKSLEKIKEYITLNRKLRLCGIVSDLVIAYFEKENEDKTKRITAMIEEDFSRDILSSFGGVHLINLENVPISHRRFFVAYSNYTVSRTGDNFRIPSVKYTPSQVLLLKKHGGENKLESEKYHIAKTPLVPWSYIMANRTFGTLVSDNSPGFTFALNSHENMLTKWNNDTRYGNNGEMLYLKLKGKIYDVIRSCESEFGGEKAQYTVSTEEIKITVLITISSRGMKKEVEVMLENTGDRELKPELAYFTEPVLSDNSRTNLIKAEFHNNAIELHSTSLSSFRGTLRLQSDCEDYFHTLNRKEFLEGNWQSNDVNFGGAAVVGGKIILPPKRKEKVKFVLSFGKMAYAAEKTALLDIAPREMKNRIEINTGDNALDGIYNNFLLNQIIDGRMFGRCGFYQCGGAYGFRDQLQDALSLSFLYPELTKQQLSRCAAVQFCEGDVLHWWHNNLKMRKGVRTRYSDDLLWLPYVLSQYIKVSGDYDFLDVEIRFLEGKELSENEHEKYDVWAMSEEKGTMLEHALRAVRKALKFGSHSLMLMGGGDWNDGMNLVGINGSGESVWLSQFMVMVLDTMSELLDYKGQNETALEFRNTANELRAAIDKYAFKDGYYVRAFCDDGTVLGCKESDACKIDILTQAFSVLCNMPDENRKKSALEEAYNALVDKQNGIVKLLSPAFSQDDRNIGYIASYPQGIRENGGQYTHAAIWFAMALFRMGMADKGYEILEIINPMKKYENSETAEKYKTEPYYFCGDVYAATGYEGRGGWSLYTGSAAWYFTAVNEMLGFNFTDGKLTVKPNLPEKISNYSATLFINEKTIKIDATGHNNGVMTVDGEQRNFLVPDNNDHIVNLQ